MSAEHYQQALRSTVVSMTFGGERTAWIPVGALGGVGYSAEKTFPSIFGTGTEDYFGYAYCRPQRFSTPFISQPRGEGNKKWGYSNNNRYHLLDDIPFNTSVQFDMEIWHPFRKNMNYAAATFFYARPGATCNIPPNVDSVRYKIALHRDDVISATPSR